MATILNLAIFRGVTFFPVGLVCKDALGAVVPLAGWSAKAEVRKTVSAACILDLAPVISADDAAGLVTLPEIPWADTVGLALGIYQWDLILVTPDGRRLPPFVGGNIEISKIITQPHP